LEGGKKKEVGEQRVANLIEPTKKKKKKKEKKTIVETKRERGEDKKVETRARRIRGKRIADGLTWRGREKTRRKRTPRERNLIAYITEETNGLQS